MTQEEKWISRFHEVRVFIESNHRNPSKHRLEEHNMLSWVKQQRKLLNAGKLKAERIEMFNKLTELWEEKKRKNQWE